jgi:arginine decarboxylase
MRTPVVVRFSDILAHRLKRLHDVFAQAIAENEYRNRYAAVFNAMVITAALIDSQAKRVRNERSVGLCVMILG